jgi:phage tail P2-like protein
MSDESLLPINATSQERAMALAIARISAVPTVARKLWSADDCPADKLAWLAWALGVDEWDDGWSEESKRQTIRDAVAVQKRKGTVWSIRRVLINAGYGSAQIIEGLYGASMTAPRRTMDLKHTATRHSGRRIA